MQRWCVDNIVSKLGGLVLFLHGGFGGGGHNTPWKFYLRLIRGSAARNAPVERNQVNGRPRDTRRAQVDDTGTNVRLLLGKCQVQSVVARYLDESTYCTFFTPTLAKRFVPGCTQHPCVYAHVYNSGIYSLVGRFVVCRVTKVARVAEYRPFDRSR